MRQSVIIGMLLTAFGCASAPTATPSVSAESDRLMTIDHYVRVRSTVPSMNGQIGQLYVRERVSGRVITRGGSGVVLFEKRERRRGRAVPTAGSVHEAQRLDPARIAPETMMRSA